MTGCVAIFGGSFDPPHLAHTLAVAYVLTRHAPRRVLVVPTLEHPFDKRLAAFEHRVAMCEIAMRDLKRVEVSRIEARLQPPSLTLRMVEALRQQLPGEDLRLVIGSDLLAETPSWHNFERVRELAPPLVVPRTGHLEASDGADTPALPAISSTRVRERIAQGAPIDQWVCPDVADYIARHALYAQPTRS